MGMKIKKGDLVEVISGPSQERGGYKGKQGKVVEVFTETDRVIVEGVNFIKKQVHVDHAGSSAHKHELQDVEAPIHISNVAIVDPETKKPTRVGFRVEEVEKDGKKKTVRVRYAKTSGKDL